MTKTILTPSEIMAIAANPSTPAMAHKGRFQAFWKMKHCRAGVCIVDSGWYLIAHAPANPAHPPLRELGYWHVGATEPVIVPVPSGEAEAKELVAKLVEVHPDIRWTAQPLEEYGYYAEADAPDWVIGFSTGDDGREMGLVDPYSTAAGHACPASYWGISEEAAQLVQAHNKVFITKYEDCNGPRMRVIEA